MMLVDVIYEEAKRRAQEKLDDARREADSILARARSEAEALRSERLKAAEGQATAERRRIVAAAELDSQRKSLAFKERLVEEVFDAARRRLGEITSSMEYPELLRRLIVEAVSVLSGRELVVMVRKEDIALVNEGLLSEVTSEVSRPGRPGVSLRIEECDRLISGGCILRSPDGHCVFDNSFERRLERQVHYARFKVAEALFADDGDEVEGQDK